MPRVLRTNEKPTMYPVKNISDYQPYDPYHDYYVIRKDKNILGGRCIGLIKNDDKTCNLYIAWLDDYTMEVIPAETSQAQQEVFKELLNDFEVIELDNDEYSSGCDGRGVDFNKGVAMRKEIITKLLNYRFEA